MTQYARESFSNGLRMGYSVESLWDTMRMSGVLSELHTYIFFDSIVCSKSLKKYNLTNFLKSFFSVFSENVQHSLLSPNMTCYVVYLGIKMPFLRFWVLLKSQGALRNLTWALLQNKSRIIKKFLEITNQVFIKNIQKANNIDFVWYLSDFGHI